MAVCSLVEKDWRNICSIVVVYISMFDFVGLLETVKVDSYA